MSLVSPTVRRWIDDGLRDPEGLWERAARELPWFRPCSRAFVWDPPTFRWFVGAETNLAYNAVDRHVLAGQSGRAALAYINERGERRVVTYWQKIPGAYYTCDSAWMDDDGYVWFGGRADEIIKIAGHRIDTIEVESACLCHPAVAECGVVGRPDDTRGEVISAFVLLKHGQTASDALRRALLDTIRHELGPIAVVGELNFVSMLPKTRSGKIMRRVLTAVILDRDPGDITTIEDEGSVEEARAAWRQMKAELARFS